jgi:hypothetical protein
LSVTISGFALVFFSASWITTRTAEAVIVRIPSEVDHRFRSKWTTHSGRSGPPIPDEVDHLFRAKWTGHSGRSGPGSGGDSERWITES